MKRLLLMGSLLCCSVFVGCATQSELQALRAGREVLRQVADVEQAVRLEARVAGHAQQPALRLGVDQRLDVEEE